MTGLSDADLEAVGAQLEAAGVPTVGRLRAELITGGRSNLTYTIEDDRRRWVLRRPPAAGATPSAHDVAREYRVTSALAAAGTPVPAPVLLCEDPDVIGAPFTVVDFVDGTTIQSRDDLADIDDDHLERIVDGLVGTLARLHAVDHVRAGLGSFGKPDGYAARQVRRWSSQWDIVGTRHAEVRAPLLAEKLADAVPEQPHSSVVHGDYRCDNTITDVTDGRVLAVVDWELSTIGDPVADVATMCAYRHPAFDKVVGMSAAWTSPRLPDADELAARYAAVGDVPLDNWPFHMALAYYKLAVIAAGIDHRYRAGGEVGDGFDQAGDAVDELVEAGLQEVAGR